MARRLSNSEKSSIRNYAERYGAEEAAKRFNVSKSTVYNTGYKGKERSSSDDSEGCLSYIISSIIKFTIIIAFKLICVILSAPFKLIRYLWKKNKSVESSEEENIKDEQLVPDNEMTNTDSNVISRSIPGIIVNDDAYNNINEHETEKKPVKYRGTLLLFYIFTSFFGGHRFYAKRYVSAIIQLLMFIGVLVFIFLPENDVILMIGGILSLAFFIFLIVDFFLVICGKMKDNEKKEIKFWTKKSKEKQEVKLKKSDGLN